MTVIVKVIMAKIEIEESENEERNQSQCKKKQ